VKEEESPVCALASCAADGSVKLWTMKRYADLLNGCGVIYTVVVKQLYILILSFHLYHCFTYLLAPWSRVPLEKLTGLQLVKKFAAFYGTRKSITAFTTACYRSLS
jgi:hypothetical protein